MRFCNYFFLLLVLFTGLIQAQDSLSTPVLKYTGSSTIGNFIQDATPVFGKVKIIMDTRPESSGGELAILEGRTDFAGIARPPNKETLGKGVISSLLGWDAIAIIVNQDNPVQNLTQSQLKSVFTGKVKNWKELGGPDLTIHPYIVGIESATRKVFRSVILREVEYVGCEEVRPDANILERVANDRGAIGHISFSFLNSETNIKAISINGQAPVLTNSYYPITRPLYLLWWPGRRDVAEFVDWVLSGEGQRIVMKRFIGTRESTIQITKKTGTLIVYSETYPVEDGGIFYYPHRSYEIFSSDGIPIMVVPNHLTENDENPSPVDLNPGHYIIKTKRNSGEEYDFFVSIESGKVTKVNSTELPSPRPVLESDIDEIIPSVSIEETANDQKQFFDFYGDFRVRLEQDLLMQGDRFRGRFRIRAGMSTQVSSASNFDLRFVSTSDPNDPNSSHVNLNDGFNQIRVAIDRASFHFHPPRYSFFQLWLGKFSNPLLSSNIFSEIVWDADIQPEGTAFSLTGSLSRNIGKVNFTNGTYLLAQFKFGTRKNWLNTSQFWVDLRLSNSWNLTLASSLYYFANIKGQEIDNSVLDANEGNSTFQKIMTDGGDSTMTTHYQTDFHLIDNFVLFKFNQMPMPLLFKFQLIYNIGASKSNRGYVSGVSYGTLEEKNHWKVYYQYHYLEQDAVFTPFVQDDALRKTNTKGHVFGLAYTFHKKISLHAWGLLDSQAKGEGNPQSRFRMDLNVKF